MNHPRTFARLRLLAAVCGISLACSSAAGCTSSASDSPYEWSTSSWFSYGTPGSQTCTRLGSETAAAQAMVDRANSSLHELIYCGGAQVSLSKTLFVAVLLSNATAFGMDEQTVQDIRSSLGIAVSSPISSLGDGRWRMQGVGSGVAAMDFDLRFHDASGQPVLVDPTLLDSYLTGVQVSYEMTFAEMKTNPTQQNVYRFSWQGLGPLGELLLGPRGELPNPIELRLSAFDLLAASSGTGEPGQFGPFAYLLGLGVSSELQFTDPHPPQVTYRTAAPRAPLRRAALQSLVDFAVLGLAGRNGSAEMALNGGQITFSGKFAGGLDGQLQGVVAANAQQVPVSLVFTGGGYGTVSLQCE